jgi:arginine decarboxylase
LYQKQQTTEKWNMIDSSFITTLPDTWAINKRFIMLAVNRWNETYERGSRWIDLRQ